LSLQEKEWPLIDELFEQSFENLKRSGKNGRDRTARMKKRFTIVIPQVVNWSSSQREETLGDNGVILGIFDTGLAVDI
jgi:hypothetical protein